LFKAFKVLTQRRFDKLTRTKQFAFLLAALRGLTPTLSPIIAGLLPAIDTAHGIDLNGLTRLSDAAGKVLSQLRGRVYLGGLTSLSDAEAELLSKFRGELRLYGLTELGCSRGHGLLLTKLTRYQDLQLPGVERLSDTAAAILSRQKGDLYLDGLKSLSDAAAKSFGKHLGSLSLDGLTRLSDSAAISLGRNRGDLSLCGLKTISDAAAKALSVNPGWLRLDSITSLSPKAALYLGKHRGHTLEFNSLRCLSDAAAKSLSGFKGKYLRLAPLNDLSGTAMKSLSILLKEGHDRLQVDPALRDRIWLAGNRKEQPLGKHDLQRRIQAIEQRGSAELKEYTAITDEAAELLASMDLYGCDLSNLTEASDQALKSLAGIKGIELSPAMRARVNASRISMRQLKQLGFMKYADAKTPDWQSVSWGGQGLGAAYQVTDQAGVSYSVGRVFGADVEELVEQGVLWFFSSDLTHFDIDATGIEEATVENVREWRYHGSSYPISGKGIGNSTYDRAAFALVAILNRLLQANGSEEKAFGINEGNAFGVVFLTEPLRKVFARVTNEEDFPVCEKDLRLKARSAMARGEPPLVKNHT